MCNWEKPANQRCAAIEYQVHKTLATTISNSPPLSWTAPPLPRIEMRPPAVDRTEPMTMPGSKGMRRSKRAVIADVMGLDAEAMAADTPLERFTLSVVSSDVTLMPKKPSNNRRTHGNPR